MSRDKEDLVSAQTSAVVESGGLPPVPAVTTQPPGGVVCEEEESTQADTRYTLTLNGTSRGLEPS